MHAVKVEQFEGPLDVLLSLIQEEKLDITAVSLASIADQYLERLAQGTDHLRAGELADFLVVAAKLLFIKSKLLLPYLTQEDEQEIEDLARQLKIYQEFLSASRVLQKIVGQHRITFQRPFSLARAGEENLFLPPKKLTLQTLRDAFYALVTKSEPEKPSITISFDAGVTVQEKMIFLKDLVARKPLSFLGVLRDSKSKTEIIVSFLALLELVKQRIFVVAQEGLFGDIIIRPFAKDL
ncbi:segregation/condensation protein A [Candidatus Uhrbacteria bacterium]|nr:segregation/condensation protein A [Candidatus Uhrbacteria bacterium]